MMLPHHHSGDSVIQAATRLGGSDSLGSGVGVTNSTKTGGGIASNRSNPAFKCFEKAVRIVTYEHQPNRFKEKDILGAFNSMFSESVMIQIESIGFFQPQFSWIITFRNKDILSHLIGKDLCMFNEKFSIQDASIQINEPVAKRTKPSSLTFRIKGLPVAVSPKELSERLNEIGFEVKTMRRVPALSKIAEKYRIFSDLVDFTVEVLDEDNKAKIAELAKVYDITLQGVSHRVHIFCFGFCFRCKKYGHTARSCQSKVNLPCFICKDTGHMKKSCPDYVCKYCNVQGHNQKNCQEYNKETLIYDNGNSHKQAHSSVHSTPHQPAFNTPVNVRNHEPSPSPLPELEGISEALALSIGAEQTQLLAKQQVLINGILTNSDQLKRNRSSPNSQSGSAKINHKRGSFSRESARVVDEMLNSESFSEEDTINDADTLRHNT